MLAIEEVVDKWEKDEPLYEELGAKVTEFLKKEIPSIEILPEVSYRTKDILSIVKKIKKKLKDKEYDYDKLNDKLGIRIICTFKDELDKLDEFLKNSFIVVNIDKKKDDLDFNRLDYLSNHYDLKIDTNLETFKDYKYLDNLVFEVQVRTLNQHAWSNAAHSLSYKQEAEISNPLKRRVYRLLSLYEIADDEFSAVNDSLIHQSDNYLYSLLRKLEGKIYKYAKVDFDRELAIYTLKILLTYFDEAIKQEISISIIDFINTNDTKIKRIFDQNKVRFHEIPLLTQPEVFIIWFANEKYPFNLDDNWGNDFDKSDLDQITTLWGGIIN